MENQESTERTTQEVTTDSVETKPTEVSTETTQDTTSEQPTTGESQSLEKVDFTSTADNNKKVVKQKDVLPAGQRKKLAKTNVAGVTKAKTGYNQQNLAKALVETAAKEGFTLKIDRGRLSNMINGSCNVTSSVERACKALLKERGYEAVAKDLVVEEEKTETPDAQVGETAVA